MKRLYLLRHAQASSAHGGSDFDRTLSDAGKAEARALGLAMKKKYYQPDLIYCSPALRTQQTLAGVLESLEERNTETPRLIYEGSAGDYLNLIQHSSNDVDTVLMVAHNPSIHQLAAMLANEHSPKYEQLMLGYAPATLTVLDCDIEDWSELQPGNNELAGFILPTH